MPRERIDDRDLMRFAPRITVMLIASFLLFMTVTLAYGVLPVVLEPPPPDAIPDYHRERVIARLEGKVLWLLGGSFLIVALAAGKGWLPGTRRR